MVIHLRFSCEFCDQCTIKEAHETSYIQTTNIVWCNQLQKSFGVQKDNFQDYNIDQMDTDDLEIVNIFLDNSTRIQNCLCGKPNEKENLNANNVEKTSVIIVQPNQ